MHSCSYDRRLFTTALSCCSSCSCPCRHTLRQSTAVPAICRRTLAATRVIPRQPQLFCHPLEAAKACHCIGNISPACSAIRGAPCRVWLTMRNAMLMFSTANAMLHGKANRPAELSAMQHGRTSVDQLGPARHGSLWC